MTGFIPGWTDGQNVPLSQVLAGNFGDLIQQCTLKDQQEKLEAMMAELAFVQPAFLGLATGHPRISPRVQLREETLWCNGCRKGRLFD